MNWTDLGVEFIGIAEWDVIEGAEDGSETDGYFTTRFGADDFDLVFFFFSIFYSLSINMTSTELS